jgi:hypothetical protein
MDVTNPGLTSVADQAFPPDLRTNSLAIPLDDDILVAVANQKGSRAENDVTSSTFPIPAEEIVARQAPVPASQDFGEVPGVAPAFLPFPQNVIANTLENQNLVKGIPNEYTVAGPEESIQTNASADTVKQFKVVQVIDADTGLSVTIPVPGTAGTFTSIQNGGTGILTVVSPTAIPPILTAGLVVTIAETPSTSYDVPAVVANVLSLPAVGLGTMDYAVPNIAHTGTTFGSSTVLPLTLTAAKFVAISGTGGAPPTGYDGVHAISNVKFLAGNFASVAATDPPIAGKIIVVSSAVLPTVALVGPTGLADGQLVFLSGTYGWKTVSGIVNISGSFASAADSAFSPGVQTTFTSVGALPAALASGQQITISGTGGVPPAGYDGTYEVLNVTANTFDVTVAFSATKTGNWSVWNFLIVAALGTASGTWSANTFDIDVANTGTTTGFWNVYTFDIAGTYVAPAVRNGTWTYTPPQPVLTSRYNLIVTPAELNTFGVSMLGRQILFDDGIPTTANEGAARIITMYGGNFITIARDDPNDQSVPVLTNPHINDTFTLDVQRQGAEPIFRGVGQTVDVTIAPLPAVNLPTGFPSENFQGNVDVTVGPQPGEPVITSGVRVPKAIDVNVADQDAVIGLPKNIFP